MNNKNIIAAIIIAVAMLASVHLYNESTPLEQCINLKMRMAEMEVSTPAEAPMGVRPKESWESDPLVNPQTLSPPVAGVQPPPAPDDYHSDPVFDLNTPPPNSGNMPIAKTYAPDDYHSDPIFDMGASVDIPKANKTFAQTFKTFAQTYLGLYKDRDSALQDCLMMLRR